MKLNLGFLNYSLTSLLHCFSLRLGKGGYSETQESESDDDDEEEKKPADPTIAEILSDDRTPSQNLRHRSSKVCK